MLFDGQAVLPKAATPKTANLTKISYGEQPALKVHYYDAAAWSEIADRAEMAGDDPGVRVAREIVENAKLRETPVAQCLAKEEDYWIVSSAAELQERMNDYVGENGRFTPLVAATEICWPDPRLEGVEIVDTPGMNDPVGSRVQKTREYLAHCDVVFFLSRSSQFLDKSDLDLFTLQLPNKGVKRLWLVATQFDSAILDDGYDRDSLAATIANVKNRLQRHASQAIAARKNVFEDRPELKERLQEAGKQIIFMSSHAEALAHRPESEWDKELRHLAEQFADLCAEWRSANLTPEDWAQIANFEPLRQALAQSRAEKEAILDEQRCQLEPELAANRKRWQEDASDAIKARIHRLEHDEIEDLSQREAALKGQVARIAAGLEAQLSTVQLKARKHAEKLQEELREAAAEHGKIEVRTGYDTERRKVRVSDSKWWNPFSWGRHHHEYYETTVSYRYIATTDVVESILGYLRTAESHLAKEIGRLVTPEEISAGLRRTLVDLVDTGAQQYDPMTLRALVTSTLGTMSWPQWNFTLSKDPTAEIERRFSGEVREDDLMSALRKLHDKTLREINEQFANELSHQTEEFIRSLHAIGGQIGGKLTESIEAEITRLRQDLSDREAALAKYRELLGGIAVLEAA